ncbi:hypothetical protein LSTR_LSTR000847 [Laodelphax striatellus]|uniref:DNA cross-link repair 1A protein n=1 Tax=Laodelphax striatellus TaxID=195883 RepID=A0A482X192_LAOST|nr:hypothetical protein LSTR_LSTR000847 [Laodelphax striatellus]
MISRFNEELSSSSNFCPLCQAPLQRLKVSSEFHIGNCSVSWDSLDECPDGVDCANESIFHYRDYSHSLLAGYRCSNLYIEEKTELSPEKRKKTPLSSSKSPRKSPKRPAQKSKKYKASKQLTVKNRKSSSVLEVSDEDDNDLSLFKPKKILRSNLVSKRKLYKSNSDIPAANSNENKKVRTDENVPDEIAITSKTVRMSKSTESDSRLSQNYNEPSVSSPKDQKSSKIAIKEDLESDLCVETKISHHKMKSENECFSELESSNLDEQSSFTKSISHTKSSTSDFKESNPKTEIDLQFDDLKFDDESSIPSPKNVADNKPDIHGNLGLAKDLHIKTVESESDKTKQKSSHPKFDFFAPKKPVMNDNKRHKPKKYDLTFSNVKTIIPGVSDEPSIVTGIVTSEKPDIKATGNTWRRFGSKSHVPKVCPFYKRIPDTNFVVDAFQYGSIPGVQAYFLTHFHSDHYIGLRKGFSNPIYCSKITANLVKLKLGVNERYINVINLNERTVVNGVEVVALDANHCPGSVMLLFQLRTGQNYLHVGDFRANTEMESYPELKRLRIHKLFLDTTYCKPAYTFPSQKSVIEDVVKIVKAEFMMNPRTLIVVGSYLIGKEKVFMAIAEEFDCRVWAEPSKMKIFDCIENKELKKRMTSEATLAQVHVVSMAHLGIHKLKEYLRPLMKVFSRVVAFRPTGWCHNSNNSSFKRLEYENVLLYEVPYSEHSSYSELQRFVQFTKPDDIIPTVNVNESSLKEMNKHFKMWLNEKSQPSILDFVKGSNAR